MRFRFRALATDGSATATTTDESHAVGRMSSGGGGPVVGVSPRDPIKGFAGTLIIDF